MTVSKTQWMIILVATIFLSINPFPRVVKAHGLVTDADFGCNSWQDVKKQLDPEVRGWIETLLAEQETDLDDPDLETRIGVS